MADSETSSNPESSRSESSPRDNGAPPSQPPDETDSGWVATHLAPKSLANLRSSGLSDSTIRTHAITTLDPGNEGLLTEAVGDRIAARIKKSLSSAPYEPYEAYTIPYPELLKEGEPSRPRFWRVRFLPPLRLAGGKDQRYCQPSKTEPRLYVPRGITREALADPDTPVTICEGEKKALLLDQLEVACLGLGGIWNFQTDGRMISDFARISWTGRPVSLVPDANMWRERGEDPYRLLPVYELMMELEARGALVIAVELPIGTEFMGLDNAPKVVEWQLDDYVLKHGLDALDSLPRHTEKSPVFDDIRDQYWRRKRRNERGGGISDAAGPARIVRLSDVTPTEVSWIWPDRIPRSKLVVMAGDPGLGKSYVSLDIAAHITRGASWPVDATPAPQGTVLLLSAEDGLADTIRPRLDRLGGDPSLMFVLTAIPTGNGERMFSLVSDLHQLETAIAAHKPALVIIDPLSAYLGKTDSFRDAEVRGLLSPLAALAEKTATAILAIMHVTKSPAQKALYRVPGSIGFVGAARATLVVAPDPDPGRSDRRLLLGLKNNLSRAPSTLAFQIDALGLHWAPNPVAEVDVDSALAPPAKAVTADERSAIEQAKTFLVKFLTPGEQKARDVKQAAKLNGVSEKTLHRAKRDLKVDSRHEGRPGGPGEWYWTLPVQQVSVQEQPNSQEPNDSPKVVIDPSKVVRCENLATFEQDTEEKGKKDNRLAEDGQAQTDDYLPRKVDHLREEPPAPQEPRGGAGEDGDAGSGYVEFDV